jgi:hypothetical protein
MSGQKRGAHARNSRAFHLIRIASEVVKEA